MARRIFDLALQGQSNLDIVKTLNAEGIPTSSGKRWLKTTIHAMLTNEAYTGTLVWGSNAKDNAPPPLTASLENVAASHDGENTFTFELRFSEEFSLSYRTLRNHAFSVTGGTVKKAQRASKPSNTHWRITVRPNGDGQVSIVLPITTDCDAQGAICTDDGRMLSNRLELPSR